MNNIYHVLNKTPTLNIYHLGKEKYFLAQSLLKEGLIRIDTNYYCNFIYYINNAQNIKLTFSINELSDSNLLNKVKNKIKNKFLQTNIELNETEIEKILSKQKEKLKLLNIPPYHLLENITYLLVQSSHNIVFKWIIKDRVEIFITYGKNIGDVMDISSWKYFGKNSGMQSIDVKNVSIYVSCGGDPFRENNSSNKTIGDGWAAISRMQIIAAQEIGHFADIKRNFRGQKYSRHSVTNLLVTKPEPKVAEARKKDINICESFLKDLINNFPKLIKYEKTLLQTTKVKNTFLIIILKILYLKFCIFWGKTKLKRRYVIKYKLLFLEKYILEKFPALSIEIMLKDMLLNLSPIADVYKRKEKLAEEAIACAEALARVPQQSIKWGHLTTKHLMSNLYYIYYDVAISSLVTTYDNLFQNQSINLNLSEKISFFLHMFKKKSHFKKLPIINTLND